MLNERLSLGDVLYRVSYIVLILVREVLFIVTTLRVTITITLRAEVDKPVFSMVRYNEYLYAYEYIL